LRDGVLIESDGKIVFINNSYARTLGYDSPEELLDKSSSDILLPADVEWFSRFSKTTSSGEPLPCVYELRGKRKDGSLIDLEATVSTSVIAGKTYNITAVRDLSDQRRAVELIEESGKRYRLLGENILHQVWTAEPDGKLDYVNSRTLEYSGLPLEEALKEVWQNAVHPDDLPVCNERWGESLRTGAYYEVEFRMRGIDGKYRWHLGRATAVRDQEGKVIKWFGTNTDIHNQKSAEQLLRQSEERFQLAARATNDVLWDWNIATGEMWFNESIQTIFGYRPNEIGNTLDWRINAIHPQDRREIEQSVRLFARGDEQVWQGEYRCARADGSYATVIDRGILLRDERGKPLRMLGSMRDITERRKAEQALVESETRLRQSQKMEAIGTLTGGVAHDFNNLLTAILGNTQLALRNLSPEDAVRPRLLEIERAGNRAATLTRQLLAFSRRQHLERKTVNLNDSISDVTKLLERIIGEDVEITVRYAEDLLTVFADASQIEQVVMNLAVNARDAMPQGGKLTVATRNVRLDENYCRHYPYVQPGSYVQIQVCDTGIGMSEETKSRIFEPFFTTKEIGKGTGLGLSMAYGIIKQHNGHINVYSEIGYGTNIKIYLPVYQHNEVEENPEIHIPLYGGTETILVAEDEEALQLLAKDVLESSGYTVLLAKNGEEAVNLYFENRERIDLLLLDVVMPQMGGAEAYEQIRDAGADTPVIFMTGYSSETVQNRFVEQSSLFAGLEAAIIQKPYTVEAIERKIRDALNDHH
jgi:PAS domain S-box-containing protein